MQQIEQKLGLQCSVYAYCQSSSKWSDTSCCSCIE